MSGEECQLAFKASLELLEEKCGVKVGGMVARLKAGGEEKQKRLNYARDVLCNKATDLEYLRKKIISSRTTWLVAGLAGTFFLLDLVIPSVGTMATLTASGILSALGLGGMVTSDLLRRLRTSQLKKTFEDRLRSILEDALEGLLLEEPVVCLDLAERSERLERWTRGLRGG